VGKKALAPRCAAACEAQSDGFRPGRGCHEAIEAGYVALHNGAVGHHSSILEADIHGAFAHINPDVILHRLGPRPGRERIKHGRKAGDWEHGTLPHTTAGTPQGGVLRPLLAHIALDGVAHRLGQGSRVTRYAADLLVMAQSLPAMEQACPVVSACLDERGRALHPEQTRIIHRTEGVDFLGFQVQRRGQQLLSTPQQQQVQALLHAVRSWLRTHPTVAAAVVTRHLNPLLRGWARDYRHVVRKQTCQNVDHHLWRALWCWAQRRHPKQPQRWTSRRYCEVGKYGATFYANSRDRRGQPIRLRLERMPAIPMVRHGKGKGDASPDDPTLQAYGDRRRWKMGRQRGAKGSTLYGIAAAQRWQCPGCRQALCDGQEVHLHPRIPVCAGEVMQERTSHGSTQPVIANDTDKASLSVNRLERHARKPARAVLRGGGDGDTASLPDPPLPLSAAAEGWRWTASHQSPTAWLLAKCYTLVREVLYF
jgi:RNA-directed DNA polymerase